MIIFFILVAVVSLCGIKQREMDLASWNQTYLSKDSTNAIKGIFILLVFIRHANQYVSQAGYEYASIGDRMFLMVDGLLAQLIVVMFLFFSGYGIMCSINHGGQNYIRSIPKRRLLNTLINFDVAVLFYVGIAYVVNDSLVLKQVLLSLVGWDSVGNSNWYICVILICYLSTYISFLIVKSIRNNKKNTIAILFIYIILAITTYLFILAGKTPNWYDTMWVYPLGMLFALYRTPFEHCVSNRINWCVLFFTSVVLFVISYGLSLIDIPISHFNIFRWGIRVIALIFMTILLMIRYNISNRFIVWLGANLFPLYIYQRIPMIVLAPYLSDRPYIFFALTFMITCLLVFIYKKIEIRFK